MERLAARRARGRAAVRLAPGARWTSLDTGGGTAGVDQRGRI
eukprot:COSAG06_NODE_59380_length_274_cov_0.771429_1_plen_41_part_01